MGIIESNKTHIVYTYMRKYGILPRKIYFNGNLIFEGNTVDIEWSWTEDKKEALDFVCTDAWDLLGWARNYYKNTKIELERIRSFE